MSIAFRNLLLPVALAAGLVLGLPAGALAAGTPPSPGVHIDPSSPAAREYALPLATARGAPADSGSTGSLFGSGIKKNSASGSKRSGKGTASTSHAGSASPPSRQSTSSRTGTGGGNAGSSDATRVAHPGSRRHHQRTRPPSQKHRSTTRATVAPAAHRSTPPTAGNSAFPTAGKATPPAAANAVPAAAKVVHPGASSGWIWMLLAATILLLACSGAAYLLNRGTGAGHNLTD